VALRGAQAACSSVFGKLAFLWPARGSARLPLQQHTALWQVGDGQNWDEYMWHQLPAGAGLCGTPVVLWRSGLCTM
jgi:hypothetical protein